MIAIWFDPGLLTGVCVYDFTEDRLSLLDEFSYLSTGLVIDRDERFSLLSQEPLSADIRIGWESYRIMKGPQTQAPWSLEVIGMLRYLSAKYGYTVLNTAEPKAREVTTPDMLSRMDWYDACKGKKDALSAAQHMVAWMLRERLLPERYKEIIVGPLR